MPAHMMCSSMEVGVCAEAYQGREPLRHINSAFMTFEVLDSDRKPCTLPRLRPEPVVSFLSCIFCLLEALDCTDTRVHKKSVFFVGITVGFPLYYRTEEDAIKKLLPERRFASIG